MNFIVKSMARKGPKSSCRKQSAQVVLKCCQATDPDLVSSVL